jgi:hypothetical protein
MEVALDQMDPPVPYVVLSNRLDRSDPQRPVLVTAARFSPGDDFSHLTQLHPPMPCSAFVLSMEVKPRVIICKLHGSLTDDGDASEDGLIISDNDYVNFIAQKEPFPADVTKLLTRKLMFLGYSLNDWNVRSIFEAIRRQRRGAMGDICVIRHVRTFEALFFEKNNINVYQTDLNTFADEVLHEYRSRFSAR